MTLWIFVKKTFMCLRTKYHASNNPHEGQTSPLSMRPYANCCILFISILNGVNTYLLFVIKVFLYCEELN